MLARRICTSRFHRGPRWCLAINFHVDEWVDYTHEEARRVQTYCRACHRINARIRNAARKGLPPYRPFVPVSEAEKRRRRQQYDREYRKKHAARLREYDREWAAIQRRKAGKPIRGPRKVERDNALRVTISSFTPLWARAQELMLTEMPDNHGGWFGLTDIEYESLSRAMRNGNSANGDRNVVSLRIVERVLINSGLEHRLNELEIINMERAK